MNFLKEHAKLFYNLLGHTDLGFSELRIIDVNNKKIIDNIFVNNVNDFLKVCEKYSGKYNVYVGRLPRPKKEHGNNKNIEYVNNITLDIDALREQGTPATNEQIKPVFAVTKEIQERYPHCIPYFTGNGVCIWFKFETFRINDKPDFVEKAKVWCENLKKEFEPKFKVIFDPMGDVARIQKVAGTKSVKGVHTKEAPHRMAKFSDKQLSKTFEYSQKVVEEISSIKLEEVKEQTEVVELPPYLIFLLGLNRHFCDIWYGRKEYESPSERDLSVAVFLVKNHMKDEQILFCLEHSPYRKNDNGRRGKFLLTIEKAKSNNSVKQPVKGLGVRRKEYTKILKRRGTQKNPEILLGFPKLDEFLWLQKKEIVALGGLPSTGKSAMLLQCAYANAKIGRNVLYVSTEVSWEEIVDRICAQNLLINTKNFRRGQFIRNEVDKIKNFLEVEKCLDNIFVFDSGNPNVLEIERAIYITAPDLVIYDHIQQGKLNDRDSQARELKEIMQSLKNISRDRNIGIIIASQFRRDVEGRRPTIYDFYGSAGIEQVSDICLLLSSNKRNADEEIWSTDVIIGKGRNVGTSSYRLEFNGKYVKFKEY
jgi:archaellum biogenesis ATPase FlaH